MRLPGVPYTPAHASDEVTLGVAVAFALHVLAIGPFVVRALLPAGASENEGPLVARPVVQASLLKLGKPLDPKNLPDRLVPQERTAPKKEVVASNEPPSARKPDAGAPPPDNAKDSDIQRLVKSSDPFAEDAGKVRPEEGRLEGVDGGQETDPNKVRAGDAYAAMLGQFLAQRLTIPTVISPGEERRLCVVMDVRIGQTMVIWNVAPTPYRSSGNPLFDDAARSMLLKLLDDRTQLPAPPKELDGNFRNSRVRLSILGPNGDPASCPK